MIHSTRRCFSQKKSQDSATNNTKLNIQERPAGEKEIETEFPLPDREKEQQLGQLQSRVQEEFKAGNYVQAQEAAQELLAQTKDHFGDKHPATASAYNNLGLLQKQLGNFTEARGHYQQALDIYRRVVGKDHASYASALHNIATLNKTQIHLDSALRATDRLTLIEQAEQYLQQAYQIRKAELGEEHPHTVASRSAWGATLATQILHYHKVSSSNDPKQRQYISMLPEHVTKEGWKEAEEHLRHSLQIAIANPRGPQLKKKRGGKQKAAEDKKELISLSAASAAQNLAVVLKAKAMTKTPYDSTAMKEAYELYQQVLNVRGQLLPKGHPDMYATQHSWAEILEAMGDTEAANNVRQDIIDTYDPPTEDTNQEK